MPTRQRSAKSRKRKQTVKGGLKGFAEAKKSSIDLLRDIQTHVTVKEARSGNDHRSKTKIHVSELTKSESCPRRLFYKVSGTPESDTEVSAGHRLVMIWSAGTAEHEKWQGWLREMGDLWGTWHCLQCEHEWEATSPPACEKCGRDAEERAQSLAAAILAFTSVGYLAVLVVGVWIWKARPWVGGAAAIGAIALGRLLQVVVKPPVVEKRAISRNA